MKNLVSNWVFTLIETVLLAVFAVLMFFVGDSILNILVGVALLVYIALIVLSKVLTYRGIIQLIALLEFFVVTVLAVLVIVDFVPFEKLDPVNFTVGVAMWFRATTEILHSYHGQGQGRVQKKNFNAWIIFIYILLVTFGTFIAATSFLDLNLVKYVIGGVATGGAVIMLVLTITNYMDYRERHPRPVKIKKVKPENSVAPDDKNALAEAKKELPEAKKEVEDKPAAEEKVSAPEVKKAAPAPKASEPDDESEPIPLPADDSSVKALPSAKKEDQLYIAP